MFTTTELRDRFLAFFADRGHQIVASSPLVPGNDPTLLFTNAGMVQFKEVFLGEEKRAYTRAASSQRCVRAGGKHNDLENVGYTARHHTFFEMLGNFSFGDYFKREAIHYAWEFLTQVLEIPANRLFVTVFEEDDEAADIWLKEVGVDSARFARIGAKDNFWSMGDTGPCGPCTEIFYDHGPEVHGGPPGSPDEDGDRFIEIWNLVFMQYDRNVAGELKPLPKPSVDTGMGLERLAAVMQDVHSNYEIDLFQNLLKAAAELTATADTTHTSLRVIADHIRSCAFLIVDGVLPSNEGRGYVLRRIIRRAVRHGSKLGVNTAFFHKLVAALDHEMGGAYPELRKNRAHVEKVLRQEEERFAETLDLGLSQLESDLANLQDKIIPGDTIFKLYDTYGFPVDLTADIARERGFDMDMEGFEQAMEAQRERARSASQFGATYDGKLEVQGQTEFVGYEHLEADTTPVVALFMDDKAVDCLETGHQGVVVLARTPFYAESGGQVGDTGSVEKDDVTFEVRDTQKHGDVFLHIGTMTRGTLYVGDQVSAQVDANTRKTTAYNHSATHLLHAALRKVLGEHVTQKGSLVEPGRLRFDFSHYEPVTAEQLERIERMVNDHIRANHKVQAEVMALDEAMNSGAMALFGEKYGDKVRVLRMGQFSVELCGGTHVRRTGDIGTFKIVSETGVAAGVRRIEAVTGQGALDWLREEGQALEQIAALVKGGRDNAREKVAQLVERNRALEKELDKLKAKLASSAGSDLASQAVEIDGLKVLAARIDGADVKALRDTLDQLKNKLGSAAIVLSTAAGDKVSLVAGVTKDQTARIKAGELVNMVAQQVGGRGGGRPDMAQAGGNNPAALDGALKSVPDWIRAQLGA